jgi:TPR repeat protein
MSAEQGDIVAMHWIGVFYHEGYGVAKNIDKAIKFLTLAGEAGNGLSFFQLYMIYSGK